MPLAQIYVRFIRHVPRQNTRCLGAMSPLPSIHRLPHYGPINVTHFLLLTVSQSTLPLRGRRSVDWLSFWCRDNFHKNDVWQVPDAVCRGFSPGQRRYAWGACGGCPATNATASSALGHERAS